MKSIFPKLGLDEVKDIRIVISKLLAELIGTMILTFFSCGSAHVGSDVVRYSLTFGFTVATMAQVRIQKIWIKPLKDKKNYDCHFAFLLESVFCSLWNHTKRLKTTKYVFVFKVTYIVNASYYLNPKLIINYVCNDNISFLKGYRTCIWLSY